MEKYGEGFIISNKIRKAVFSEIASGEHSIDKIAKKHHLLPRLVQHAVTEITDGELIEKTREGYQLTEHGKKILIKIKSHETI
jgi:predicted transcriptional regulator